MEMGAHGPHLETLQNNCENTASGASPASGSILQAVQSWASHLKSVALSALI